MEILLSIYAGQTVDTVLMALMYHPDYEYDSHQRILISRRVFPSLNYFQSEISNFSLRLCNGTVHVYSKSVHPWFVPDIFFAKMCSVIKYIHLSPWHLLSCELEAHLSILSCFISRPILKCISFSQKRNIYWGGNGTHSNFPSKSVYIITYTEEVSTNLSKVSQCSVSRHTFGMLVCQDHN